MALLISEEQVKELVNSEDAFQTTKASHVALSKALANNVTRVRARCSTMSLHTMSATSSELKRAGAKVYSATKNGICCSFLLYDTNSGELLSIIEANELGRLRTAAASAVAASALLPRPAVSLGIIGSGYQAMGIANAFFTKASGIIVSSLSVYSRSAENRDRFADACAQLGLKANVSKTAQELVESCEVVVTATTSTKPVVDFDWIKNVIHVSAVGSNALSRQELHPRVVTSAKKIVVDTIDAAKAEAGDLLWPIENGKLSWEAVSELGNLLSGRENYTRSNSLSLFCSQGLAVQDLYLASLIYDRANL